MRTIALLFFFCQTWCPSPVLAADDARYLPDLVDFIKAQPGQQYSAIESLPRILRMPLIDIQTLTRFKGSNTKGAYIPKKGMDSQIVLLDTLDIENNICDRSVLLHELVHYYQYRLMAKNEPARYAKLLKGEWSDAEFLQKNENEAYSIQYKYLRSRYSHVNVYYSLDGRLQCHPL